jgi:hypothetical protein
MAADDTESYDWVFDYSLVFLESDKFDAAVMDFVDEKCDVFDSEDENKFIYSDIHQEFSQHIEALIESNLQEVGVTVEMFYESCERAGQARDINRAVFERMLAMEDFNTFKRIMVKRNTELQLLAMQDAADDAMNDAGARNVDRPSGKGNSSSSSSLSPHQHLKYSGGSSEREGPRGDGSGAGPGPGGGRLNSVSLSSPMTKEEEKDHLDRAIKESVTSSNKLEDKESSSEMMMQATLRSRCAHVHEL